MRERTVFRRAVSIVVCAVLILTSCFTLPSYADKTVLSPKIYYHLDMGVQLAYNNGSDWGSSVYGRDSSSGSWTLSMGTDVEVVDVYPYEGSGYNIDNGSHNLGDSGQERYNRLYKKYISTSMSVSDFSSGGHDITFTYTAKLNSIDPLDVVEMGEYNFDNKVYELFGSKSRLEREFPQIADAVELALDAGHNGTAGKNRLYLVFCPNVIEYRKYVTVGALEADLNLPETAKQSESFTVEDATSVDSSLTLESSAVRYRVDNGAWQDLIVWPGNGMPGTNSGGWIQQKFDAICKVDYEITAAATNDQTSKKVRTINIVDSREVNGQAILELPEFTYEGHPALAKDVSVFTVNGINYSAQRAYAERVADNDFSPNSSYGDIDRLTDTKANVTYSKKGTYNVTLYVDLINGSILTDTKPIEVRKTPYIVDSLGGFQKENRKQILTASVATYPGKPIVDYYIRLKDLKTGQEVILTKDEPQRNNAAIKTRTVISDGNQYWTNFTLEFLTKNTASQQYQYTIYAEDSKGDSDIVQKEFTVKPDLPPVPVINMQDTFIRNKGTNVAEITTEDASTTDGDQLERAWSVGGKDLKSFDGYKDLAFGAGQKIQFDKVGVGKTDVKLFVKDVWIEPTLEEYVTDADRKSATAAAVTDVINIAPTVRLEPRMADEVDVALMARASSAAEINASVNGLKAALIEAGVDPRIFVINQADPDSGGFRKTFETEWDTTINSFSKQSDGILFDSEYAYRIVPNSIYLPNGGYYTVETNPHTVHAMKGNGTDAWSYTVNQFSSFFIQQDQNEKYFYIVSPVDNKTLVLNRKTGAYLTTFKIALPKGTAVTTDNFVYVLTEECIYRYTIASNELKIINSKGGYLGQLMNGKFSYIIKEDAYKFSLVQMDLESEEINIRSIPDLKPYASEGVVSNVKPTDMDTTGKIAFIGDSAGIPGQGDGISAWVVDINDYYVKALGQIIDRPESNSLIFAKDESNKARFLCQFSTAIIGTSERRYTYINVYTLGDRNTAPVQKSIFRDRHSDGGAGIAYVRYNSDDSCIYLVGGCTYGSTDLGGGIHEGFHIKIDTSTFKILDGVPNGWSASDEMLGYNDYLAVAGNSYESWTKMTDSVKMFKHSITAAQAKESALSKFANFRNDVASFVEDSFSNASTTVQSVMDAVKNKLTLLVANKGSNVDSITRSFDLNPGQKYYYEYAIKDAATGSAFTVQAPSVSFGKTSAYLGYQDLGTLNAVKIYREDFNDPDINPYFTVTSGTVGSGTLNSPIPGNSSRTHDIDSRSSVTFNVPSGVKAIVTFDAKVYLPSKKTDYGWKSGVYVNGRRYEITPYWGFDVSDYTYSYMLSPGINTIQGSCVWSGYGNEDNYTAIDNLRVIYLDSSAKQYSSYAVSDDGDWKKVTGSFEVPIGTYKAQSYTHYPSYAFTEARPSPVSSGQASYTFAVPDGMAAKVYTSAWGQASMNNTTQDLWTPWATLHHRTENGSGSNISMIGDELFYAGEGNGPLTFWGRQYVQGKYGTTYIKSGYNYFELFAYPSNLQGRRDIFFDNINKVYCPVDKYTGQATINIPFSGISKSNIKNLKVYYVKDGKKFYIEDKPMNAVSDVKNWTIGSNLSLSMVKSEKNKDEEAPMVYKKGQLVAYSIFYDDYENDPSQKQFWRYTHTPYNDGPHPDAATILDEDGNVMSSNGKVLSESIPRFYIDGKYTVEHWQMDNTNRTGDTPGKVDYSKYDKLSNVESLTFYIEGGGTAPWITSIKTVPAAVKEGDKYKLQIGVDDAEKDELRVTTELYKDKKLIYTHKQSNIIADANGNYPLTTTGYAPTAAPGVYDVVCTVRDWSGAGIGTYRFTVVSKGKITGLVNHTDQWDDNRKKYNLKRFSEEINRTMQLDDYIAMATPRMRGTNVFWSGEKFMLRAETEGKPSRVEVSVQSVGGRGVRKNTGYSAELRNTGKKTAAGAELWEGSLWDRAMINKWGRKNPEPLYFTFTASYAGGVTRTDEAMVIIDSRQDYWQLHRLW